MLMRGIVSRFMMTGLALSLAVALFPQARRQASSLPRIRIESYNVKLELDPALHEMKVVAGITVQALETTDIIVLEISENLSVNRITDLQGGSIDFGQDETGPGELAIHLSKTLAAGESTTLKAEYSGGFDLDRYSRNFTKDESAAYIGMEGSYLLYQSKWLPVGKLFTDRPTASVEVTVPLGMTAVGPGTPLPIVTRETAETFGWAATQPVATISVVAGRYFERKLEFGELTIDTYAREDHIDAMRKSAEALAKVLEYYQQLWGAPATGKNFRLVEVDDRLDLQQGMLGTIFVTHSEVAAPAPPVRELARRAAYQWWKDTVGVQSAADLWLVDGMSYYAAAQYLGEKGGPEAMQDEIDNLAVLGLKFESRSTVREGIGLGYGTEFYESVVAGKGASVLNMLKGILGPAKFADVLKQYRDQAAAAGGSTSVFAKIAEQAYGQELGWFFAEWINTMGVPNLQVDYVVYKTRDGFRVSGSVKQDRDLFRMPLEIEAVGDGSSERATIDLNGRTTPFDINLFTWPKQVVIDPDNKILRDSDDLQLKVQLTLGDDAKQKSNYVDAIRAYEKALRINPRKSLAHFRMAEVFFEQMNLQAAANTFRDALNGDQDPKWIEVWCYLYLGKIYDILGQRQRAMAEYNKALNTKDNTNGALDEAKKWLANPFSKGSGEEFRDNE